MKIEIGRDFPQHFRPSYPEEFELFSHFEVTAGIPTVLFAITTWKENGKPNVCFHSWSCFHGDKTAFFVVMGNLGGDTGWERKMPGLDGVVAMVDADVHGFAHPFLAVVENLVSCWLRAKRILFFPSW